MSSGITYNLVVYLDGQEPCQYELRAQRIGIGRGHENHIHLNSPAVSSAHLELHRTKRGYELEDLLSSNGTLVNGFAVQKCVLQDGDRILIGGEVVAHYVILPGDVEVEQAITRVREPEEDLKRYLSLRERLEALNAEIREKEERLRELDSAGVPPVAFLPDRDR